MNGPLQQLPDCSWQDFCVAMDIKQSTWAAEFLRCLAVHFRESQTEDLPNACIVKAEFHGKDPYVVWVWMLTPNFRDEPPSMAMRADARVADNYYLLQLMREKCKEEPKNWKNLAAEVMSDFACYYQLQQRVAAHFKLPFDSWRGKFPD